ncbi:MAG: cobalt-zinc-cadmium resistance protein [Planctomycetota bacterium]|nr:MAG: cobalt-zinc-cadmium resistance protein [Planctomycetota bacterium]
MESNPKETLTSGAIAWMANNSVTANLLMLVCLFGGIFALFNMKQEVFPEFDVEAMQVSVIYQGASPEEVEDGILLPLEEAIDGLEGIDKVWTTAREGVGTVIIKAFVDANFNKLVDEVQREVDRIRTFPLDAERPQIKIFSLERNVLSVVLFGDAEEKSLHEMAESFRTHLLQDSIITQVDLSGVRPLEISIEISQANLRKYNLTPEIIAQRLRLSSIDLPGGSLKTENGEILIRMKEKRYSGRDFGETPIISDFNGSQILLKDIAKVTDGYEDSDYMATYNKKRAIMFDVKGGAVKNPIKVSKRVKEIIKEYNQRLPDGIQARILNDSSKNLEDRINLLSRNTGIGVILVLISLALFLEIRLAFWVMMGIPISFLGSLLFVPALGVSINMISLFAYIIALGIVVDDAIVIGENIYHYRQKGYSSIQASIKGAKDMVMPVSFSILTNIVTFLPLAFLPGTMGKIFKIIPMVVITVFLISLFESFFILPAHLGNLKKQKTHGLLYWLHQRQQTFSDGFKRFINIRYSTFLNFILQRRYLTAATSLALLVIVLSYVGSGRMGLGMFPKTEADFARAKITLPFGTTVERTLKVSKILYKAAEEIAEETGRKDDLVVGIFTEIGRGGSHKASLRVYLAPPEIREAILSTDEFARKWRKRVGEIPGISSLLFESDFGGPGHGAALSVQLNHSRLEVLEVASKDLAQSLSSFSRLKDIDDGFSEGKDQYDFMVLPQGKALGLTAVDIARQVRNGFFGAEVLRQQRGRNELRIKVRLPENERMTIYDLFNFIIKTPNNKDVYLRDVVEVKKSKSFTVINRRGGRRIVEVQADVMPRSKANEVIETLKASVLPELIKKYPGLEYSFEGRQAEMKKSLNSLVKLFLVAILATYAVLAIPLKSYAQPLIIMVSIPFGIIGAFIGHLLLGYDLSLISMFGIVALSGVVVNDSLVLIDMINQIRRAGERTVYMSIISGAIQRFRPIIITTITTFGGLMPMMLETSRQAKFLIPMAISIGFGVLFATTITLILVPALYLIIEDTKKFFKRAFNF